MEIILIVAVSRNGVIGKEGSIPWNLKEDTRFFKKKTSNSPVIMGRATYESIGKPLPDRLNIVITRSPKYIEGIKKVATVEKAIEAASKNKDSKEIYIIGGENIYKEFLPIANRMLITEVELEIPEGDTFFPAWDINEWKEKSRDNRKEKGIKFSFVDYQRI